MTPSPTYQYHQFANGIRLIFRRTHSAVAYSGVYINIGSRDEQGPTEGIAHFIEHSLFKGTTHRRAYHVLSRIDGVGGELNAFTTKEETCIYASSLNEHLDRCLELFSDVLFCSTFPDHELEKEKDVVLDEIDSYRDSPSELIYDQFEELAFEGHPLAHNILGTKTTVRHFTADAVRRFFNSRYTTDRMVVSVVADIEWPRLVRLCERHFADHPLRTSEADRSAQPHFKPFCRTVGRRTHQLHALVGCQAPHIFSPDRTAFTLMSNLLGGPAMNSRLGLALRERHAYCYTVESQYVPFSDTGLFYVYAGLESGYGQQATELIMNELTTLATTPLSDRQLRAAKRQLIGQMAVGQDQGMNEMQSIGKARLNYDRVDTLEEMARDVEAVSATQIQELAKHLFVPDAMAALYYK
ncbi:MAG: insulinase family protein [Bacteroidales bacterium]|nr:insulinase family protein [Bacteroidales bacterium]